MKRFFLILLFYLLSQTISFANERDERLKQLFNQLKINNVDSAYNIEQKIWQIWTTHPSNNKLTARLKAGSDLMRDQKFYEAEKIFSELIQIDQNWSEAWNKRATVLYLQGKFKKSQYDINKVLELEQRHFGALTGQGLVNIELKNFEKAIKSYQKVQEIYPSMKSPKIMIERIERLIKDQTTVSYTHLTLPTKA